MIKFDSVISLFNQANLAQNKVESIKSIDSTLGGYFAKGWYKY